MLIDTCPQLRKNEADEAPDDQPCHAAAPTRHYIHSVVSNRLERRQHQRCVKCRFVRSDQIRSDRERFVGSDQRPKRTQTPHEGEGDNRDEGSAGAGAGEGDLLSMIPGQARRAKHGVIRTGWFLFLCICVHDLSFAGQERPYRYLSIYHRIVSYRSGK